MAVARTCAVECRRRSMSVIVARISGVLRSSCILLGGEINHEEHEGHGEFLGRDFVLRNACERGLLACSARQPAEHKFPSASCRRLQAGSLRPQKQKTAHGNAAYYY